MTDILILQFVETLEQPLTPSYMLPTEQTQTRDMKDHLLVHALYLSHWYQSQGDPQPCTGPTFSGWYLSSLIKWSKPFVSNSFQRDSFPCCCHCTTWRCSHFHLNWNKAAVIILRVNNMAPILMDLPGLSPSAWSHTHSWSHPQKYFRALVLSSVKATELGSSSLFPTQFSCPRTLSNLAHFWKPFQNHPSTLSQ